jgi:dipeptidyl-peptidase-4
MKKVFVVLVSLLITLGATAQTKSLTIESIYDPKLRVAFGGAMQSGFEWLDDTTFIWPKRDAKNEVVGLQLFDVTTGKQRAYIDRAKMRKALEGAGVPAEAAEVTATATLFTWDAKKNAILFNASDDLWLYNLTANSVTRLTSAPGEEEEAAFSPDGRSAAFVRANNLFAVDVATQRERQLTTDGSAKILNGRLDWVYQEEIYGRGTFRSFWWSPDSKRIAFLQLDETAVHEFTVVDHVPTRQELEVQPYPKAGDPNPKARLFVVPAGGGAPVEVEHERYTAADMLIVDVKWSPTNQLYYQVQNRVQTWLDLNVYDPAASTSRTLLRETTKAWVEPISGPEFLSDGSFLWMTERTGWRHIEHYSAAGTRLRQVTSGEWEARTLHGVDEKTSTVYFSGTERSPIGVDVYSVKLDGTGLRRLSADEGTHTARFSPDLTYYVDTFSNLGTPASTRVYRRDGTMVQVVEANPTPLLAEYGFRTPERMQVKTRDGFVMEATMLKPPGFDPSKKYPVFQATYGGPHAPQVRNAWGGATAMFHQLLANQGIIVWVMDNRTASGKGAVSAWVGHRNLGESELRDIEDGLNFLKTLPYVDGSRVLLSGWSYGGYLTAYALTHSTSFKAGIAGAPVTDWRGYDSIYTERVMGMPQDNPEGYDKSSPLRAAKNLHGNLLLLHGTFDDNVHLQNTLAFAYELQKEGKQFEMMLYPRQRHSFTDQKLNLHLNRTILDFARRNLLDAK